MKVRFTTEAKADLQQIGDYIAKDNPSRALSFIDELANIPSNKREALFEPFEASGFFCNLFGHGCDLIGTDNQWSE